MAVVDTYVVTGTYPNSVASNSNGAGDLRRAVISFEVTSTDDDGSIYRLMQISANSIITNVMIGNDAITSGTVFHCGFYDVEGGAVVDVDKLGASLDLSAAHVSGSELSAMSAVDVANRGLKVYELLGKTVSNKAMAYDLALTGATVGSATGTVTVFVDFIAG